jgi:hypothetical protein
MEGNKMSDTPETDEAWDKYISFPYSNGAGDLRILAQKLEREGDDANSSPTMARDILRKLLEIIPEPECQGFEHTKEERHTSFEKCPVMDRYDALIAQAKEAVL